MTPPKLTGIIESALYVEDVPRSVGFYQRVLGFTPAGDPESRLCAMDVTPDQVLLLFKKGASVDDKVSPTGTIPGTDGDGNLHIAFGVPSGELDAWAEHLRGLGIDTVGKSWPEGGDSLYFKDPDGHVVELKTSTWRGSEITSPEETPDEYVRRMNARPVPDIVYHASPSGGVTRLEPRLSTHGKSWVYATEDLALSALHLGEDGGGDLGCSSGYSNEDLYLYERWDGAFDARYECKVGYVYELPGETFKRGMTKFTGDLVSEVAVDVLKETRIDDAKAYLLELEKEGRLRIFMVNERPAWIPEDDQDLVDRIVLWSKGDEESSCFRYMLKHLPHLAARVREALKDI